MPALLRVSLIAAVVAGMSAAAAGQQGVRQPSTPPVIFPTTPSDLLIHSPLAASCPVDGAPPDAGAAGAAAARAPGRLRIVTWNIFARRSASTDAVAAELEAMQADVIALQEVDVRTRRSGFVDEPAVLAAALGFQFAFAASIKWDEGDYGLAVLSRWPLTEVVRHRLQATAARELRIVLEARFCVRGKPLRLFNHHADGGVISRTGGFAEFVRLLQNAGGEDVVVLGDFNDQPGSPAVGSLASAGLVDLGAERNESTSAGGRIDYIFAGGPLRRFPWNVRVWPTKSSDHQAVVADVEW